MENPTTQKDSSPVMNPVRRAGLIILLFGLGLLFWSVPAHSESAVVVRVIDGDTITVQIAGAIRTIRLIGVDTPETVHPTKKIVQPGGPAASAFAQAALDRQTVELVTDPKGDQVDRYDRLLRYVYLDGKDISAILIGLGYGRAIRAFPYSKRSQFVALEADARKRRVGMWAGGGKGPMTTDNPLPVNTSQMFKELRRQAEQGWAGAQFILGILYEFGPCVPQDYQARISSLKS